MSEGRFAGAEFVEVRFGGSGGQGVILMGVILAVAATRDHLYVVQTQSYGPEARGGYSRSDVILARRPIEYPQLQGIDLLVVLSEEAARRYAGLLRKNGVFIYDSEKVRERRFAGESYAVPFTRLTEEVTGREQSTNVLSLAAAVKFTGLVTQKSLELAVRGMVPSATVDVNMRALEKGLSLSAEDWRIEVPV
ncbi:MAG: 2-oxoacid:ferredoxin oxidoreductase subunit gamma [Thermoleophilia bacterium]